jgi:hypothetical protein
MLRQYSASAGNYHLVVENPSLEEASSTIYPHQDGGERHGAVAAGLLEEDEDLPNDYFISDVNPLKREFVVSGAVAITTATRGGGFDQPATWAEFVSWWGPSPAMGTQHLHDMPWWIERDGSTVVKIDEQYIP